MKCFFIETYWENGCDLSMANLEWPHCQFGYKLRCDKKTKSMKILIGKPSIYNSRVNVMYQYIKQLFN